MLVVELWGIGDVALAVPFLQAAATRARVTLLAKKHAAPILRRFAPEVELVSLVAPWTAFSGKYRLHRWPWRTLTKLRHSLRQRQFDLAVSGRPDPRDHFLLRLAGARRRLGYPRAGSNWLLTEALSPPDRPHRAEHWRKLAETLGWQAPARPQNLPANRAPRKGRIVIHTGAGHPVRRWPRDRFVKIDARLRSIGRDVLMIDDTFGDLDALLDVLADASAFIGNDSGPGHLAALSGVPTFTIFGPQLPELFAPRHPKASWIEGGPCPYKPCFDACRFPSPHCLESIDDETAWLQLTRWLSTIS